MSEIRDYQVDHLLLLVGSNPLPNAVAGKLLTAPGGTITLIHSLASDQLAQRLALWFGKWDIKTDFKEAQESDGHTVAVRVREALLRHTNDTGNTHHTIHVGLNYTGGTKVMAVHAYRALEQWTRDHNRFSSDPVFSYLDASTLQMCFDGTPPASFYIGRDIEISIDELLELHNWQPVQPPIKAQVLPESARALLAVQSSRDEAGIWTEWLHDTLFPEARKWVPIRYRVRVYQSRQELPGQYDVKQPAPNDKWKSKHDLRNLAIPWPSLPSLKKTMSKELEQGDAEHLELTAGTGPGRCKDEEDFCKWLSGIWLESAVLSALQDCPPELRLNECCMDIKPKVLGSSGKRELFQFDVAAMRGYQLFAFSCSTDDGSKGGGRWLLKQKLFEVYVRARQMGGDEACAALVCCAEQDMVSELQAEMRRDMSLEGRIRIFGRNHLTDLARHIANWIREQSKEG